MTSKLQQALVASQSAMPRLPVSSSLGRCLGRSAECPPGARAFSRTIPQPADESQTSRSPPTRSAKAFELIRKLPTGNNSAPSPRTTFDDASRAASRASSGPPRSPVSSGPPKELVRRARAPPVGAPTSSSRFGSPQNNRSRASPPGARGRNDRDNDRGARRSKPRRSGFNAEDQDSETPEDASTADRSTYASLTDDALIERFRTLAEARAYAKLQDFVTDHIERADTLDEMENEARAANKLDAKYTAALESVRKDMDSQMAEALEFANQTDEEALPRHTPVELGSGDEEGALGGATVGKAGMGNAVEAGLRHVAARSSMQGDLYVEPRELARRLIAGDFVKFRHAFEKRTVLREAETLGWRADTNTAAGEKHVGFEELGEGARRTLVQRLVQGQYKNPADQGHANSVLRNVARITGGNATYSSGHRAALMKTIGELLPAQRAGGAAGQRPAQKSRQ